MLRRDAIIVTVCAATVIAASWLPWQENRDSYDFGPAAAVMYHVCGWDGWNPLIATCASCAVLISWLRTIRDSRQKRVAGVVAGSCGLGLAASCYVGLVAQSQVRPAIGLGITLVSLALLIAAALWNDTRAHAAAATWYSKGPSRWCAVALVGLALGMTGYVPSDDPPRSGAGGTRMVGKYLVQYELDDAGITLLVVMSLPDDLLASGGGQQDGRYNWTYSFGSRGPLTLRWTRGDAEIDAAKYDLKRGRILCLVADTEEVRSLQLPLPLRVLDVRSRFRWTHHGVEDEIRRVVAESAVNSAMDQLRHG